MINSEKIFKLELNNILYENWDIVKSNYQFCYMDFLLFNRNNLYNVFIEYKKRHYTYNKSIYTSFFIGEKKLKMIDLYYNNSYLIWDFRNKNTNETDFFYLKYDKSLLESKKEYDNKHYSYRFLIDKNKCKNGFDNFINEIKSITNINLDKM